MAELRMLTSRERRETARTVVTAGAAALRELSRYEGTDPGALVALLFTAILENLGFRQLRNLLR
jgi:hypothetical protein